MNTPTACYCRELRQFLDAHRFLGHARGHQERCLACVNAIIEEKNELVRQLVVLGASEERKVSDD